MIGRIDIKSLEAFLKADDKTLRIELVHESKYDLGKALECLDFINKGSTDEDRQERHDFLKSIDYKVSDARLLIDFAKGCNTARTLEAQQLVSGKIGDFREGTADGIYIIYENDVVLPFDGHNTRVGSKCIGIGVRQIDKAIMVAMDDAFEKPVELTRVSSNICPFTEERAILDWNGKRNSSNIKNIRGLCVDDWYVPSYGEWNFLREHLGEINGALEVMGGKPLSKWYWTSTPQRLYNLWRVYISYNSSGLNNHRAKMCHTRLRLVREFTM